MWVFCRGKLTLIWCVFVVAEIEHGQKRLLVKVRGRLPTTRFGGAHMRRQPSRLPYKAPRMPTTPFSPQQQCQGPLCPDRAHTGRSSALIAYRGGMHALCMQVVHTLDTGPWCMLGNMPYIEHEYGQIQPRCPYCPLICAALRRFMHACPSYYTKTRARPGS